MKNEQVAIGMITTAFIFAVVWLWRKVHQHYFLPEQQKAGLKTVDDLKSEKGLPIPEGDGPPLIIERVKGVFEIDIQSGQKVYVNVGCEPVYVIKMFGPLIFADLRIQANADTCEWVIERLNPSTCEWSECCRIPGQKEGDFEEEK
jgi:hypothetical protein